MLDEMLEKRKMKMDKDDSKKLGIAPDLKQETEDEVLDDSATKEGLLANSQEQDAQEGLGFKLEDLLQLSDEDKMRIMEMINMQKEGKPTNSSLSDKVMMTAMKE